MKLLRHDNPKSILCPKVYFEFFTWINTKNSLISSINHFRINAICEYMSSKFSEAWNYPIHSVTSLVSKKAWSDIFIHRWWLRVLRHHVLLNLFQKIPVTRQSAKISDICLWPFFEFNFSAPYFSGSFPVWIIALSNFHFSPFKSKYLIKIRLSFSHENECFTLFMAKGPCVREMRLPVEVELK